MKTTSDMLKLITQVCWVCVHVVIAMWAIRQMIIMGRALKSEYRNKDLVVGRIVR